MGDLTFKQKLRIVWDETGVVIGKGEAAHPNRRYVVRGLDSGPGWQVFDRKRDRFLTNKEIKQLSEDELRELWVQ